MAQPAAEKIGARKVIHTTHFGIQRKIVGHMTSASWKTIPHVSFIYEPDVTAFFEEYRKLNASGRLQQKVSFNTLMLRAIMEAIKAAPIVNSCLHFNEKYVTGELITYETVDVTMPWVLEDGSMMTINMHGFDSKNLDEMTEYIAQTQRKIQNTNMTEAMYSVSLHNTLDVLKKGHILEPIRKWLGANFGNGKVPLLKGKEKEAYKAISHNDRLTRYDLEPGTITVSNIGSLKRTLRGAVGILEIITPQVMAIGIGAVQERPVVVTENGEKTIAIRQVLPMCIALDHRAMDFGDIVPFTDRLDEIFAHPEEIHTW